MEFSDESELNDTQQKTLHIEILKNLMEEKRQLNKWIQQEKVQLFEPLHN